MLKKLLLLLLLFMLGAWLAWQQAEQRLTQAQLTFTEPLFELTAGRSAQSLCRQWQREQQLAAADCLLLRGYLKFYPQLSQLQQGVYRLPAQASLLQVLQLFRQGQVAQFSITFIEGETLQQSLDRVAQQPYLQQDITAPEQLAALLQWPSDWGPAHYDVAADSSNSAFSSWQRLEGRIFPDTYFFTANTRASVLLSRAHQALLQRLEQLWQQRDPLLPLQNKYQLLIMASLIEKESGHDAEKGLISSVFVNRLNSNMRLQTDPTVIYGLTDYSGRITRANLNNPHPYNTYRHHGLPPGPISLVGASSIRAAAQPDVSDYYYFVSRGDGSHHFSTTLQQHNAAVRKYILGQTQ
ncbi:endolytic transglycosylase MltG [Arsukibacterium sp.]|uniref:endolytic transglycosylase MltG n=1 Tax=Arsukibacterium sp. TaxID=1977258 RepID=UPI002FDAB137